MDKNLTNSRNGKQNTTEKMYKMRDVIIGKIKGQLPYLFGTVYERKGLDELSPNEAIDKIIEDLLALKEKDNFKNINNEYVGLREERTILEENISRVKGEILKSLDTSEKNALSMPIRPILGHRLVYCIADYSSQDSRISEEEIEKYTLGDLITFCVENEDWEEIIKHYRGLGVGAVEKIKKLFEQYNIKI